MQAVFDPWLSYYTAIGVGLSSQCQRVQLDKLRHDRLAALVAAAQSKSALYADLLKGLDPAHCSLNDLPIANKQVLMGQFDAWVCDASLRLGDLARFIKQPELIAQPYLDRYVVWESSGTSGTPGVFIQDAATMAVYDALEAMRRRAALLSAGSLWNPWGIGDRLVFVGATSGHFASIVSLERLRRVYPVFGDSFHSLSFLQPIQILVARLNELAPCALSTYPSVAAVLAQEQLAGRLKLKLKEIWTGGETLTPALRGSVQAAFACPVVDSYGTSEFLALATECKFGRMHVNSDWALLESVDTQGCPVPDGVFGETSLLTNLANHVQPIIRYDLGDQIKLFHTPCPCGSPHPHMELLGRHEAALQFSSMTSRRRPVHIVPLALSTVLEEDAGLYDFQLVQHSPYEVSINTPLQGASAMQQLRHAKQVLDQFLKRMGTQPVQIHCHTGMELQRGRSGKVQRIVAFTAN